MKQIIKNFLFAALFIFFVASPVVAVATPQVSAAAGPTTCEPYLFGIMPPWYRGLTTGSDCTIVSPEQAGGLSSFIWKVVLNVVEIALVAVSIVAVLFIIYGGFLFITGGGNTSQIEKARKSIFNAIIGLVISLGAIAVTNLIFTVIGNASSPNEYGIPELREDDLLQNGLNLAYYIGGIVAVIVIVIAGFMYATSQGDAGRITRAKGMILYAVIGLGVLFAAFAITNFVIRSF